MSLNYTWRTECSFWRKKKLHLNSALLLSPTVWNHLWWFFLFLPPFLPFSVLLEPELLELSTRLPCTWASVGLPTQRHETEPERKQKMVGICLHPCSLPAVLVVAIFLSLTTPVSVVISFSGSGVHGVQITPFSPCVPAWCLTTHVHWVP